MELQFLTALKGLDIRPNPQLAQGIHDPTIRHRRPLETRSAQRGQSLLAATMLDDRFFLKRPREHLFEQFSIT